MTVDPAFIKDHKTYDQRMDSLMLRMPLWLQLPIYCSTHHSFGRRMIFVKQLKVMMISVMSPQIHSW